MKTQTRELQLHEANVINGVVHVAYSLVDDYGIADVNCQVSKKALIAYLEDNRMNYIETVDSWLPATTYLMDNLWFVVKSYLEDYN